MATFNTSCTEIRRVETGVTVPDKRPKCVVYRDEIFIFYLKMTFCHFNTHDCFGVDITGKIFSLGVILATSDFFARLDLLVQLEQAKIITNMFHLGLVFSSYRRQSYCKRNMRYGVDKTFQILSLLKLIV